MQRTTVSQASVEEALSTLDLQSEGLLALAEAIAVHGLRPGDIEKIVGHAKVLDGLREDIALSLPDDFEGIG